MNETKMPPLPEIFDHMDVIVGDIGASQLISAVHEYARGYAEQVRAEEREACASLVMIHGSLWADEGPAHPLDVCQSIAHDIRNRGQA